jgi:4-hydroxy-tetrahydrodipicolinate synthase
MHPDESLRLDVIPGQVERFIAAGIDGLFCAGTNGEFYALSYAEKVEVIGATIAAAAGRLPVCAGVGCVTTRETVSLAREAQRLGATLLAVVTPYYAAVSQPELERHYRAVAEAVDLPIMLYNIPARTGNAISPETLARLSQVKGIVGIKDSSGSMDSLRAYLKAARPGFAVFSGSDALILEGLRAGTVGAVSGLANVAPGLVSRIYDSWKRKDVAAAEAAQAEMLQLREIIPLGNAVSVVKRAANVLGWPLGPARAPVAGIPPENEESLRAVLERSAAARASRA